MQLVAQPDVLYPRPRIAAFPAPLCEACNIAMKPNGEYRASDASAARREYQCAMCGAAKMIRRSRCAG